MHKDHCDVNHSYSGLLEQIHFSVYMCVVMLVCNGFFEHVFITLCVFVKLRKVDANQCHLLI